MSRTKLFIQALLKATKETVGMNLNMLTSTNIMKLLETDLVDKLTAPSRS